MSRRGEGSRKQKQAPAGCEADINPAMRRGDIIQKDISKKRGKYVIPKC
jgi:hypothetical protein